MDEQEETTKGKASPVGEVQSRWRKPGKPCEELQLQLEVWDKLLKERKAYLKGRLIFRANRGKGLLAEKMTNDYFHLERHGHRQMRRTQEQKLIAFKRANLNEKFSCSKFAGAGHDT